MDVFRHKYFSVVLDSSMKGRPHSPVFLHPGNELPELAKSRVLAPLIQFWCHGEAIIYLSIYLSVCLSIYLSIYLSICISIYLLSILYIHYIYIYIYKYPTRCYNAQCIFFILLQIYSTCFGCHLHPSSGVQETVVIHHWYKSYVTIVWTMWLVIH
jgi:hypothetical protein